MQELSHISLICHPSKVMLKVLLNRLKSKAESIIAEKQVRFRTGRSTIDRSSILGYCRYLQQQQDLYHVFIDCKRAFDRLWHKALWSTLRLYNINANLIQVLKTSTTRPLVQTSLINGGIEGWFRTTFGVRQGSLLSPTLFNFFLERIMTDD